MKLVGCIVFEREDGAHCNAQFIVPQKQVADRPRPANASNEPRVPMTGSHEIFGASAPFGCWVAVLGTLVKNLDHVVITGLPGR